MKDDELEHALVNWGRWCYERAHPSECESIEHLWRSPQEWHEPGAPVVPGPPIDRLLALEVNRAWRVVPQPYKAVLADWYVLHRDPRRTCARQHIAPHMHGEYLAKSRIMIANQLTRNTRRDKSQPTVSVSASPQSASPSEFGGRDSPQNFLIAWPSAIAGMVS